MYRLALVLLCFCGTLRAADEPKWEAMLGALPKTEKAGYGGLSGMCVDRATGDVLIDLSDKGIYRSTDGAKTFKMLGAAPLKGRTETPGCFLIDPTGKTKTMLMALVYGAPVGLSDDGGTKKAMSAKTAHVDWAAIDWTDPEHKFVIAMKHESGELLIASHDGGKTFTDIGKGYGPGWVFDGTTAVVAEMKTKERPKPGLVRTADGGKTWTPCGDYSPVGSNSARALPKWFDGKLYWLVAGALIATDDAGKTWKTVCELKGAQYGPIFGKTKDHLFVLTSDGIVESIDGGKVWVKPIAVPKELKGGGLAWLEYDAKGDNLYIMKMTGDLFKLPRGK